MKEIKTPTTIADLGYNNAYLKELWITEKCPEDLPKEVKRYWESDGSTVFLSVIENNILILGFYDENNDEVKQEIEKIKNWLFETYDVVNIWTSKGKMGYIANFKNSETEAEFYAE